MVAKTAENLRTVYLLMAGGMGKRLWPLSRALHPKPLLRPNLERSLMENAVSLISSCRPSPEITVLAGTEQENAIRAHIDGMDTGGARVSFAPEPLSRNTACAIALGAMRAIDLTDGDEDEDRDAVIVALPSDHLIGNPKAFASALRTAEQAAGEGLIAVIGIKPSSPETGYGYISKGKETVSHGAFKIEKFVEKPDTKEARNCIKEGFLWNCGIFVFRARVMLDEIKKHAPEVFSAARKALSKSDSFGVPDRDSYALSPDISIDYAVMEKTTLGVVVPGRFQWNDVGSWRAVYDILDNKEGNVTRGDAVVKNSDGCLVLSGGGRLVAASGLQNIAIVDEGDAVLVADINRPDGVREVVDHLTREGRPEASRPSRRRHGWGTDREIENGRGFSVKSVHIDKKMEYMPDGSARHIVVLEGEARITLANKSVTLSGGDMVEVPEGVSARVKNSAGSTLRLLEIAFEKQG